LLERLLDDRETLVRRSAAMNSVELQRDRASDKTIDCLIEAVEDREWIWSETDHDHSGSLGAHSASSALGLHWEKLAAPPIEHCRPIKEERRERASLLAQVDRDYWCYRRLVGRREAAAQIEGREPLIETD
jgi:hypothetical protein